MSFRSAVPMAMPLRSEELQEGGTMSREKPVKFTPEVLITAPRRSPAVPNGRGTHAVYTVSTYDLDSHSETVEIQVLELESGKTTLFTDDKENNSPQWLPGNQLLWQRNVEGGNTELWVGNAVGPKKAYLAGKIEAPISGLKVQPLQDSKATIAIAFAGKISEEGKLLNPEKIEKSKTSAREYDTINVRFWDVYYAKEPSTLWYTTLDHINGKYKLPSDRKPVDALKGLGLEFPYTASSVLGSGGSYDISRAGLLVNTIDPEVDPAYNILQGLWFIKLKTFTEAEPEVRHIKNSNKSYEGSIAGATFAPDGSGYALYFQTKEFRKTLGSHEVFVIDLYSEESFAIPCQTEDGIALEPEGAIFSHDCKELYITAAVKARSVLYKQKLDDKRQKRGDLERFDLPGGVASVHSLYASLSHAPSSTNHLLLTVTSLVDPSIYMIVDPSAHMQPRMLPQPSDSGINLGLKHSQVSEIYVKQTDKDGNDYTVHSWVMVPSDFDKSKKYPLAMAIHGGPQGAWMDAWSTRWNPAVWAEAGYVVVSPNPTGSTSFGFKYTDDVNGEWGGAAYKDIEATFDYVEKNFDFVDTSRAVLGGGSYGGYMTNFVAGQPLGAKMKALFSHDGVFTMTNMLSSDVPMTLDMEVGKHLWEDVELWNKYAPSSYTQNWKTPMLVIHSDNDYRCPITEGLAVFNVCQMRGIESRFLNFPDENHFVTKRENSLQWYHTVLGWCNKYAGVKDGIQLKPALTRGPFKKPSKPRQ